MHGWSAPSASLQLIQNWYWGVVGVPEVRAANQRDFYGLGKWRDFMSYQEPHAVQHREVRSPTCGMALHIVLLQSKSLKLH